MSILGSTVALLSGGIEGKALPPATSQSEPAIFGPPVTRRLSQREAKRHLKAYADPAGVDAVDWVMDAVGVYLNAADRAEWHLEKNGKRMRSPNDPQDGDFPGGDAPAALYGLLHRPNPWWTWSDLLSHAIIDLLLVGNAYIAKYNPVGDAERPAALYRLSPSHIEVIPGEKRLIERYEYNVDGAAEPMKFKPEEVIHLRLPNPHSTVYGAGIISSSPRVFDLELALVDTMADFFERGAKLSGVLSTERSMNEPLIQKVRRQFASMYTGRGKNYQVAVLERGMEFHPVQPTAAEAQFVELTKLGRDRVFQAFKVHPALVNGDVARPNLLDEARRFFDDNVMKPFLKRLGEKLSQELAQAWGVDLVFDYEYVMPEKDRLANASTFASLPGIKVGEVRDYLKLARLGDERDEIVLNLPGITTEEGGIADRKPLGPDGGRPGSPQNTASLPGTGAVQRLPNGAAAVTRPDPKARQRLRKALEDGDAAALEELMKAAQPAVTLTERTIALLERYRATPKLERSTMLEELADELPPAQKRGKVIASVAEGIRRGYSVDQIIDGYEAEDYAGVRNVLEVHHGATA